MSFSASAAAWNTAAPRSCVRSPRRGWEIAGIILGFIFAWPLALAYLVWKFMGYPMPTELRAYVHRNLGWTFGTAPRSTYGFRTTGNSAFEEYRQRELERLEEERRRLDEESRHFAEFVEELKRAKDREEFDAFMAKRRQSGPSES
jgi:hypothetical protein